MNTQEALHAILASENEAFSSVCESDTAFVHGTHGMHVLLAVTESDSEGGGGRCQCGHVTAIN